MSMDIYSYIWIDFYCNGWWEEKGLKRARARKLKIANALFMRRTINRHHHNWGSRINCFEWFSVFVTLLQIKLQYQQQQQQLQQERTYIYKKKKRETIKKEENRVKNGSNVYNGIANSVRIPSVCSWCSCCFCYFFSSSSSSSILSSL